MHYLFEIYILDDVISAEQWKRLYDVIIQLGGRFGKFELTFSCTDNVTRFYIASDSDLGGISNNLQGLLLRPVDASVIILPKPIKKLRFLQFVAGGNILDLKEKLAVKKGQQLEYASFSVTAVNVNKAVVKARLLSKNAAGQWLENRKLLQAFPANLFAIDYTTNTHYLKKQTPRFLNIEKSLHMLVSDQLSPIVEVDTFPYLPHNYYLNLTNYEFDKHSFIIGATGSGKSKFISLFVDRLYKTALRNNYRIIVIDPHASLANDFDYLQDKKVLNFTNESTGLFPENVTDVAAATELTTTLFKSLLSDQYTARLERLLRFTLFVLFTSQSMSLDMLKRFLTEIELRNQILDHVHEYVPANITKFFGADFNEIRTTYYNEAILPLVALVDEMQLQPSLVNGGEQSLTDTVRDNFLTVFSLNKVSMGEKTVKTIAGLLIQQIFLLAQARLLNQKVILIIDEVSVVQNPAIASILAEARKFNLSVILTQQYFGQIEQDLRAALFSNVYNYYVFRVSEEDARALEGNLNMELPKDTQEADNKKGLKESDVRVRILTELHPRECILRLSAGGKLNPCIKARTVDAPAATGLQTNPGQLTTYTQLPQNLPSRFQEHANAAPQPIQAELPTAAPTIPGSTPQADRPAAYQPSLTMSLSELLAGQSSSRANVKERGNQ